MCFLTVFLVAHPVQFVYLLRALSLFLLNSVFPRPFLLIGSVSPCHLQSASFGGRRGHICFLEALWAEACSGVSSWSGPRGWGRLPSLLQVRTEKSILEPKAEGEKGGGKGDWEWMLSVCGKETTVFRVLWSSLLWEGGTILFLVADEGFGARGAW